MLTAPHKIATTFRALMLLGLVALVSGPASARAQSAEKLIEKSIKHFDEGEFDETITVLRQAEKATDDSRVLARINLWRGITYSVLGQEPAARHAFKVALRHDGTLTLDPERFKQKTVDLFLSVKKGDAAPAPAPAAAPAAATQPADPPAATQPVREEPPPSGSLLRPGTRPFVASVSLGGAFGFSDVLHQFKAYQDFGYHFSGDSSGFGLGVFLSEATSSVDITASPDGVNAYLFDINFTLIQVGIKAWWDFQLISGIGLYLAPVVHVGYTSVMTSWTSGTASGDDDYNALSIQGGIEAKLLLGDRGMIFFRPASIDVMIIDDLIEKEYVDIYGKNMFKKVSIRWDLVLGGGITF